MWNVLVPSLVSIFSLPMYSNLPFSWVMYCATVFGQPKKKKKEEEEYKSVLINQYKLRYHPSITLLIP